MCKKSDYPDNRTQPEGLQEGQTAISQRSKVQTSYYAQQENRNATNAPTSAL